MASTSGKTLVNLYAVPAQGSWLLIDSGVEGSWEDLEESLGAVGIGVNSFSNVLITHFHSDHTGLAARLRQESSAALWMHPADHELLCELKTSTKWHTTLELALRAAGADVNSKAAALSAWARLVASLELVEPDHALADGLEFETSFGPLITLHTPGHSPGHCCFWMPETGLLFSGDQLLDAATPHLSWIPGMDTLGGYIASLNRLAGIPARLVLPAHGAPLASAEKIIHRDLRRRRSRLHAIEKMQAFENLPAVSMLRRLFPQTLAAMDFQLAFSEVMAFREHLVLRDRTPAQEAIAAR